MSSLGAIGASAAEADGTPWIPHGGTFVGGFMRFGGGITTSDADEATDIIGSTPDATDIADSNGGGGDVGVAYSRESTTQMGAHI